MVKKVIKKTVTRTVSEEAVAAKEKPKQKASSPKRKKVKRARPSRVKKTVALTARAPAQKRMSAGEREELLIENFVGLQKAMTNLSIKFEGLTLNISKLLQVYEEAARNYAQGGKTDTADMLAKINSLLEQNKTIAKGLVLMEGKLRSSTETYVPSPQQIAPPTQNLDVQQTRNLPTPPSVPPSQTATGKPKPKPLPSL